MNRRAFFASLVPSTTVNASASQTAACNAKRGTVAFYYVRAQSERGEWLEYRLHTVLYSREDVQCVERMYGFIRWSPRRPMVY